MTLPVIFNTVAEAEDHAAAMVAAFWLKSANTIIERGESPSKLSSCGYSLAVGELDREIYDTRKNGRRGKLRGQLNLVSIRQQAISIAMGKLLSGQFPKVAKHFSVCSVDADATRKFVADYAHSEGGVA